MSFVGFIANYADEALGIAKALTGLLDGVAINGKAAADITATITRLEAAHANIAKYLENAPKPETVVKIQKADVEAAVAKEVAKLLPKLVAAEVAKIVKK